MRKSGFMTAMVCGALALTACGSEQPVENANPDEQNSEEAESESQDPQIQLNTLPPESQNYPVSAIDEDDLARYGACLVILSSMNNIINNLPQATDPSFDLIRRANAHQATIYKIVSIEIIQSAPESDRARLTKINSRFLQEKIVNQSVNMRQLSSYKDELCRTEDMSILDASRIMDEYADTYERENERIRNLKL
jgi:hypothetical protein